jgi:hypothetical protein
MLEQIKGISEQKAGKILAEGKLLGPWFGLGRRIEGLTP